MYKELSFAGNVDAACVINAAEEDVKVGKNVQTKFTKIIII